MKKLAFVLSGGGSRGALQVGAIRALLEAGYRPDILVGTSIGAVNAAYLAVHGVSLETIPGLIAAWSDASKAGLLPSNFLWLSLRTIFNRPMASLFNRMRSFYIEHGLEPDLKFSDIQGVQLLMVAADLNAYQAVVYGFEPGQTVLEGLLASTALPPWISPMRAGERLLMDGGLVSNLPVEPALSAGATQIIALDLFDPRAVVLSPPGFRQFLGKLLFTVSRRQAEMEIALAENRSVTVQRIELVGQDPVQMWDFERTSDLIEQGYVLAGEAIASWERKRPSFWRRSWDGLVGKWRRKEQVL